LEANNFATSVDHGSLVGHDVVTDAPDCVADCYHDVGLYDHWTLIDYGDVDDLYDL
jgi:hypothetical protein